jgi:hypothetical protein
MIRASSSLFALLVLVLICSADGVTNSAFAPPLPPEVLHPLRPAPEIEPLFRGPNSPKNGEALRRLDGVLRGPSELSTEPGKERSANIRRPDQQHSPPQSLLASPHAPLNDRVSRILQELGLLRAPGKVEPLYEPREYEFAK